MTEQDLPNDATDRIPGGLTQSENSQPKSLGYVFHKGRRYYNRENVNYILPADDEENDRVHRQHWIIKALYGRNYGAAVEENLESGINVLDAGCGPGTWTLEMSKDYPTSIFYGVDILERFPEAIKPSNCHFKALNLSNPGHFPENYFGYIHQRLVVAGLSAKDWEKVTKEHVRTLAPGGWLEAVEPNFGYSINIAHANAKKFFSIFIAVFEKKGLFGMIDEHVERIFQAAGLINIHAELFDFPFGDETKLGELAWEDMCEVFKATVPAVAKDFPDLQSEESQNELLEATRKECIEHASVFAFVRFYGQKPPLA